MDIVALLDSLTPAISFLSGAAVSLGGVYLSSWLGANQRRREQLEKDRRDALEVFANVLSLLMDSNPVLAFIFPPPPVGVDGWLEALRQYRSPDVQVEALLKQWESLRVAMMRVALLQSSPEVLEIGMTLRMDLDDFYARFTNALAIQEKIIAPIKASGPGVWDGDDDELRSLSEEFSSLDVYACHENCQEGVMKLAEVLGWEEPHHEPPKPRRLRLNRKRPE
ncbi:hypothetical protein FHR72_003856 [Mycolicibacterium iranicum]|uniref:Uncharacterized protein n=1 Tax=Mycolicibacterium iranicum TaxID=912594 RepID=A0A839Q9P1_MYCIR|nr:hypothetical protein [Mycolicibacterium iranicum]MBB2992357.1 hypothetical protein [Mycolicibacterium iranicum]